ncbi:MAG: hypothetical protein ACI8PT_004354 [Gammaproteobacteria bacterium]|jgi:hypothetical protein
MKMYAEDRLKVQLVQEALDSVLDDIGGKSMALSHLWFSARIRAKNHCVRNHESKA